MGFGETEKTGGAQMAKKLKTPIVNRQICNQAHVMHGQIVDGMICAGYINGGYDACQGDSGGPLVFGDSGRYYLYGIVSWGIGCAQRNKLGVYTDVNRYIWWIQTNINT